MARRAVTSRTHSDASRAVKHEKHGPSRLWPYAPPWLIWLLTMAVALVCRMLWGGSPWFPLLAQLATHGGVWVCWKMSKGLHEVLRILAMASVAVMGLFVIILNILGPTQVLVSLWAGIGFTLCCYWTIRRMLLTAQQHGEQHNTTNAQKVIDVLNGAKMGTPKVLEHGEVVAEIEADRGVQSQDDLKGVVGALESLAGLRPGAGRLIKNMKDAGRAKMSFTPVDLLEGIIPWTGPSAFGESVAKPFTVGRYATTGKAEIYITGDPKVGRNATQWLVMGMTGAAKSFSIRTLMADLSTRKDVTIWAHDHVKGVQTLAPLIEGGALDWVTMTKADGQKMLAAVRLCIQARARWLGINGYDQWLEDCGLNLLVVWLEEAADLAQLKVLLQLVREGRSAGVIVFISMQRASHTTLDTDTRAQLGGNICFGVESSVDAKFALPDHVIDAGAAPERWRADKPAYCYISAPGIEEQKQAEELRWAFSETSQLVDVCKRGAAVRRPLSDETDQVTIKAAGAVYAKRMPTEAYTPYHPRFEEAMGMKITNTSEPKKEVDSDDDGIVDDEIENANGVDGEFSDEIDENSGEDENEDVDMSEAETAFKQRVELPNCPDMKIGNSPRQKMSTAEVRVLVQRHLKTVIDEGRNSISVPDILKMTPRIQRGREAMRNELNRLCSENENDMPSANEFRLEREPTDEPGTYRIVPPTNVQA